MEGKILQDKRGFLEIMEKDGRMRKLKKEINTSVGNNEGGGGEGGGGGGGGGEGEGGGGGGKGG